MLACPHFNVGCSLKVPGDFAIARLGVLRRKTGREVEVALKIGKGSVIGYYSKVKIRVNGPNFCSLNFFTSDMFFKTRLKQLP